MQETFEIFLSKVETEFFTLIRKIDDNLTDITWSRATPVQFFSVTKVQQLEGAL